MSVSCFSQGKIIIMFIFFIFSLFGPLWIIKAQTRGSDPTGFGQWERGQVSIVSVLTRVSNNPMLTHLLHREGGSRKTYAILRTHYAHL